MSNLARILTGALLFFFSTPPITTAEITSMKIQSDNRDFIFFNEFEFTQNGQVSVAISSASVTSAITSSLSTPADLSRIGFFLVSKYNPFHFNRMHECVLDSKFVSVLFTFRDLSPPPQSSFNKSYAVTIPNWYSLRFANCEPQAYVSMDVHTELYNTDGNTKDYLSAGLTKRPSLYSNFSLIYVCVIGFWINVCFKNHQSINLIHLIIGVLLVVKGGNLLCGAEIERFLKVTGTRPHGLDLLSYIFESIRVVLLYFVIAVTPTKKVLILMAVIPLQVLATVVAVKGFSMVINYICFCAIICQMITCNDDAFETDYDQAARDYSKKFTPRSEWFPIVGVPYLFIDLFLEMVVAYSDHWASNAANEIASVVFFMVMLYMFMPFNANREDEYSGWREENAYRF